MQFPKSSPNVPQVTQTFFSIAKRHPCSPNVLLKFWKCLKFMRLIGVPNIWPQIPKQPLSSTNIRQFTSTARHVSGPKLKMGNSWGIFGENNRTFCERLVLRRIGEYLIIPTFAIHSPNSCQTIFNSPRSPISHQLFAKRTQNNKLFIAELSQNFLIIRRFSPFFVTKLSLISRQLFASCNHIKFLQ